MVTRRPRQGGRDAAFLVSSATPDARTLLLANDVLSASNIAPPALDKMGLRLLAHIANMPYVLIASTASPHNNLSELIGKAPRSPQRIFVGSVGEQSVAHFAIQRVRAHHGLPLEAVAYNGGHAALQALVTHQVSVALVPLPSALPYLGGGRIKAWAIAESRRHPSIPYVQTTAQAGVKNFEASSAFGVYTPAKTPQSVIDELNAMLARSPEFESARQVFADFGLRLEHRVNTAGR
jgi:tripartite-type tricarboxylate transporter receptor subunit TctC